MTDEQIEMLRRLIQDEIDVAGVDGMEHGVWGFYGQSIRQTLETVSGEF